MRSAGKAPEPLTVATVDLGALASNFAEAQRCAAGRLVIAVVKADAYGHGAEAACQCLLESGCERFAVSSVAEGLALRRAGIRAPILVFGGVNNHGEAIAARESRLTPALQHAAQLELLSRAAGSRAAAFPVQVEVDTGMHRAGIPLSEALPLVQRIAGDACPGLSLEGLYTHLACADEAQLAPTLAQLGRFRAFLTELEARGVRPGLVHVANSAALMRAEALADAWPPQVNAVRPGLLLYGVRPAPGLGAELPLRPVMSLHTRVVNLRRVAPGAAVGYGGEFRAERSTVIATLPLGYADGLPCAAAQGGRVWLAGRFAPLAGRISMDLTTLDLGAAPPAQQGLHAPVLVFGSSDVLPVSASAAAGSDADAGHPPPAAGASALAGASASPDAAPVLLPVEALAAAAGTIPYELLVRVGARVPRVLRPRLCTPQVATVPRHGPGFRSHNAPRR